MLGFFFFWIAAPGTGFSYQSHSEARLLKTVENAAYHAFPRPPAGIFHDTPHPIKG